jgi:hypothetical protein
MRLEPSIAAAALAVSVAGAAAVRPAAAAPARNLVLVTADGVRIQELFGGMDAVVSENEKRSGIYDLERARRLYWRDTPEERRAALLPFFWGTLAPRGVVLGDRERGGSVQPKNPLLFSAPGYAEILTGRPQPDVVSNDVKRYPHATFLEYAQRALRLGHDRIAVIGSWDGFGTLASSRPGLFFGNNGYEDVPRGVATPRMLWLSEMQHRVMALWEEGRSDAVTFGIAMEYLKARRPRVLYLALSESDDWAHARRYDRLLDYLHVLDGYLRELWTTLQGLEGYRDRTVLIVTTDHGRGRTARDWVEHDEGIAGSEDAWIAALGPGVPARGDWASSPPAHLADVAATALRCLGLDPRAFDPEAGPPLKEVCGP